MPVNPIDVAKATQNLASIATAGKMNPQQFAAYFQLVQDQPTFLADLNIQYMTADTALIESLEFVGRITRSAEEDTAFEDSETSSLTASKKTLSSKKIRCEVPITDEFLMENLIGEPAVNYVRTKMAARNALDLQDLFVLGDTTLTTDPLLKRLDGVIKQFETIGTGVVDYSSDDVAISDDILWSAYLALPARYRKDKANLRIYCNDDVISTYKQWFGKRETSNGDTVTINGMQVTMFNGVRFYDVTSWPAGSFLLTNRMNLKPGIRKDVTAYVYPQPRQGRTYYGLNQ